MPARQTRFTLWLTAFVCVVVLAIGLSSFSARAWQFWGSLIAGGCCVLIVRSLWNTQGGNNPDSTDLHRQLAEAQSRQQEQADAFEKARTTILQEMEVRTQRLEERERDLATRFSRFHEFLEYPADDIHAELSTGELQKLSELDRKVHKLLETEAERVYEKIRRNGYTVDGRVDALMIRDEALELIKQVARIYKPDSEFPLLETSFEQLARAASRICLHTLVLLEQLPVNVQQYNISTLYGYIRKAVVGYGVYQKATPWLSFLSRGVYAGRMVAATNPASLGAWWIATELGKLGAKKVVENVVDRQAVAVLQNLVAIVGVEAAGIYGTGFRQRDPAWIFGTELVELIHSFPASTECLKFGLKEVTALPLRSEYDRIYLYRCLADHRSAGLQLADSAMLTRDQRESIARRLEQFFKVHIHGTTEATIKRWREGFERRFDLRLMLESTAVNPVSAREHQLEHAVISLAAFLQHVLCVEPGQIHTTMLTLRTASMLTESQRSRLRDQLQQTGASLTFEPPELDPASEITKHFLNDLAACTAVVEHPDEHAEQLVCETYNYFRHTTSEAKAEIGKAWCQKLKWSSLDPELADELPSETARAFFCGRAPGEKLAFAYSGLARRSGGAALPLENHWLFGAEDATGHNRRAFAMLINTGETPVWTANAPLMIERVPGLMIDDADIRMGQWEHQAEDVSKEPDRLVISGSIRGGRYRTYFRPLLTYEGETQRRST